MSRRQTVRRQTSDLSSPGMAHSGSGSYEKELIFVFSFAAFIPQTFLPIETKNGITYDDDLFTKIIIVGDTAEKLRAPGSKLQATLRFPIKPSSVIRSPFTVPRIAWQTISLTHGQWFTVTRKAPL